MESMMEAVVRPDKDCRSIALNGFTTRIGPVDEAEWAYHESLVRADYEASYPGERFDDLKHCARFQKEDKGLLHPWMMVAARGGGMGDGESGRAAGRERGGPVGGN